MITSNRPRSRPSSSSSIFFRIFIALLLFTNSRAFALNDGSDVVVVYNSAMSESKGVADHYAKMRDVPSSQVTGFPLPRTENMSRSQFRDELETPLLKFLEKQKLFTFDGPALKRSTVRYIVLCYGVPLKIDSDPSISEKIESSIKFELRKNGAAVDSELSILPSYYKKLPLTGPLSNPLYRMTNAPAMTATSGVIMVTRLDGPSPEIARSLVDNSIKAERDGLWGRAYFDMRGITNKGYGEIDTNILIAAGTAQRAGFEVAVDRSPATFPVSFPMSQIALYAGWYDENVSGPFTRTNVEFMPGAFAYHLHSYNAATLRSTSTHWAGPLLAKGVTVTMGSVDEPYLSGMPDMGIFFTRWLLLKMTYGEAAYSSLSTVSWQTTIIGDPLYRPLRKDPQMLHEELVKRGSKLVEWSHLKVVDLNLTLGTKVPDLIKYLNDIPDTKTSAVLSEKLGDLYNATGKLEPSLQAYRAALKLGPSPQQEIRLRLMIMDRLAALGRGKEIPAELEEFKKRYPDYPDLPRLERQVRQDASNTSHPK